MENPASFQPDFTDITTFPGQNHTTLLQNYQYILICYTIIQGRLIKAQPIKLNKKFCRRYVLYQSKRFRKYFSGSKRKNNEKMQNKNVYS